MNCLLMSDDVFCRAPDWQERRLGAGVRHCNRVGIGPHIDSKGWVLGIPRERHRLCFTALSEPPIGCRVTVVMLGVADQ